jgi:DNA-binding IscR family transcriptional regulator
MLTPAEIAVFRSLKKTAIVILLLWKLNQPVNIKQIAAMLQIDRGTASDYLNQLRYSGIVTITSSGWILTQAGSQLLLSDAGKIPALEVTSTTTTTTIGKDQQIPAEVEEECGENPRIDEALEALADYGVSATPMIVSLVRSKDYITADYVHGSANRLEKERRLETPLLITVIRCGDPLPLTDEEKRRRSYLKYSI